MHLRYMNSNRALYTHMREKTAAEVNDVVMKEVRMNDWLSQSRTASSCKSMCTHTYMNKKLSVMLSYVKSITGQQTTIHQVTTMLATSTNVLLPVPNHLLTTSADGVTLRLLPEHQRALYRDVTREVTEYSKSKQYVSPWFVQIAIITIVYI